MPVQDSYEDNFVTGKAGQIADLKDSSIDGVRNAEASADMLFGRAVAFDPANENAALLLASASDLVMGIVVESHAYEQSAAGELNAAGTGAKAGAMVNVMRKGSIYAVCEDGCSPGDPLFVRFQNGDGPGALLAATSGADDVTTVVAAGRWKTAAAAGGIAVLEFDFVNS